MKLKYYLLNTFFIFMIIISIKDFFFKVDIYTLKLSENLSDENIQLINYKFESLNFKSKPFLKKKIATDKYYLRYKNDSKDKDERLILFEIFFNDNDEFYKNFSVLKIFITEKVSNKFPGKLQYKFENTKISRFCKQIYENINIYSLMIRCAGIGPNHLVHSQYLDLYGENKGKAILVYDTTRHRVSEEFYNELSTYYNSLLMFNDPRVLSEKHQIIKLFRDKTMNFSLFLKRLLYLILGYSFVFIILINFNLKNNDQS